MKAIRRDGTALPGLVLIGLGGFFLLTQIFSWGLGALWPLFVMLPGLPFLYNAIRGGKDEAELIYPGILVTGTGLLLLYQNITGHWESWAYAWAFYPVFVGMALNFSGKRTGNREEVRTGRAMISYGLIGLLALWVLFEVFIFGSVLGGLSGWLIPAAMLAGGFFLLRRDSTNDDNESTRSTSEAKRKNLEMPEKPKNDRDGLYADESLRRGIDAALAEDE